MERRLAFLFSCGKCEQVNFGPMKNPASPIASDARASTGIEGLDDILGGGLPYGRLYLVQGDPGVGKTTLALQFLFAGVQNGEPGLYITLSETREELVQVARSHSWDLDAISILEMDATDALSPDAQNTLFHPSEVELGETTDKILAETDRVQPRRVVFDSLSEVRLLSGGGLRYRRYILALKQHFAARGATVMLIDDLTAAPTRELHSLAHGVLTLEHIRPEYGGERRRIFINKIRGSRFRGGYHDFRIQKGGLAVFPRLVASEHFGDFSPANVSSGIEALDELLGGGLQRGSATLLMGAAGVGKTSVALQYVGAGLERGEKAAFFAFEGGIEPILDRGRLMGFDLRAHLDRGELVVRQIDPTQLAPGEFAHHVREAVEKQGVTTVVIDSLNGYLHAMPEERYSVLHMHELLTYLNQKGVVTILITSQSGLVGPQIKSPVDISYLADAIVLIRHFEAFGVVRQAVSMLKKRLGAHERSIRELFLDDGSVRVGPPLSNFRGILSGMPKFAGPDGSKEGFAPEFAPGDPH